MRATTRLALVAALGGGVAMGIASCSLGLDESLIGSGLDGGADDTGAFDNAAPDGNDGAPPPLNPEGGICSKDEDCKGSGGCLLAKCDVPRQACVFHVCREPACTSAACGGEAGPTTCAAPKPYKYRAAVFPVGAAIGCGGALTRCFTAVYPFVFVGTSNGVLAFGAADPQSPTPFTVPITGLGFAPVQIMASGSRVYFLGQPTGAGTSSRVPIAWADVPPDPFAATIPVTTVLATLNRPSTDPLTLFPRQNDTALLVDLNVASSYPAVPLEPPLVEPLTLTSTPISFTAGSTPLAVSGTRLVMGQINGAGAAVFGFVNGAGTATPMTAPDVPIATAAPASPGVGQYLAQSADGAVFWSYVSLTAAPPAPPAVIRAVRSYFLTPNGTGAFDPAAGVDVELYAGAPAGTPTIGPVAMLDANTAMVTTASPANPTLQTDVSFVTRAPLGLVKDGAVPRRGVPITLPVSQLAAAGSNGIGYVLAVDPAAPAAPSVYVYDPACAP
ncbi:MAG: hypothetical protein KF819_37520 [Labilithrix sp.]|nr:hypothetical protein [Labilithrix sp.]